ncbi:MAG: nuclear transport factor 2 family protein [Glycocaulis sp.]
MARHIDTLLDVIEAWHRLDVDAVMEHIHDDFIWNNSGGMLPVFEGKDAMRAALTKMAGKTQSNDWRLFDYAENGDTLWMEGVDEFTGTDGSHLAVPYAGVLEFKDGRIHRWREYFNAYVQTSQREKKEISPEVRAMLDRPVVTRVS